MAWRVSVGSANEVFPSTIYKEIVFVKTLRYKIVVYSHVLISIIGAGFPPPNKFGGFQPEELDDKIA